MKLLPKTKILYYKTLTFLNILKKIIRKIQNTIPKSPFNSNPIKIQININKGCIPKVDDINLGSKNCRNKKINIYNINNEIAEKIFPELYEIKIRGK